MSEVREALTAAGANVLVPKIIDRSLLEYQRRYAPFYSMVPSFKWDTDFYYFNRRDSNPSGGQVMDGNGRPQTNSSYSQYGWQMKHTQIIGGVTGYAQAVTSLQVGDLLGLELDGALRGHMWDLETMSIWGNSAATLNTGAPQFDGIDALINTFTGTGTNAIDWSGVTPAGSTLGALSLSALDALIDTVEGNAAMGISGDQWMFLMSTTAWSRIAQLLTQQQRFLDRVEIDAGLNVLTYRDVPLIKTSFLSTRGVQVGAITTATQTTGGSLAAATYYYRVSAVIARSGETVACAETSQVTTGATSTVSLPLPAVTGYDGASPILWKVYRSTATGAETFLGTVDAQIGLASDGITPVATTSILDTGAALVPYNGNPYSGGNAPSIPPTAYYGTNAKRKPSAAGTESVYLVPRNRDFLCRPFVRDAQRLTVATTIAAPDQIPFAVQTDTTLALRAPKYIGGLFGANVALAN